MGVLENLNKTLLEQNFTTTNNDILVLKEAKDIARTYAKIEQSLAVLSDLKANISYLFKGLVAEELGLAEMKDEISSIWEDEIFKRIHADHLVKKYQLEIQFFQFLKTVPLEMRSHYYVIQNILMQNKIGEYVNVLFRMFYISSHANGSVLHALCLYNLHPTSNLISEFEGIIMNAATGNKIVLDSENSSNILTNREKEILRLIDKGFASKRIAHNLSISIHTVNRHRQNILEKLRAYNSLEACRLAKSIGLI